MNKVYLELELEYISILQVLNLTEQKVMTKVVSSNTIISVPPRKQERIYMYIYIFNKCNSYSDGLNQTKHVGY